MSRSPNAWYRTVYTPDHPHGELIPLGPIGPRTVDGEGAIERLIAAVVAADRNARPPGRPKACPRCSEFEKRSRVEGRVPLALVGGGAVPAAEAADLPSPRECAKAMLADMVLAKNRKSTIQSYKSLLDRVFKGCGDTWDALRGFWSWWEKEPGEKGAKSNVSGVMTRLYRWGQRSEHPWLLIPHVSNPLHKPAREAVEVKRGRKPLGDTPDEGKPYRLREVHALLREASQEWVERTIRLGIHVGAYMGMHAIDAWELLGAGADIGLYEEHHGATWWRIGRRKSNTAYDVPIPPTLLAMLRPFMSDGKIRVPDLLPYKEWWRFFNPLEERAGITKVENHGFSRLRSTFRMEVRYRQIRADEPTVNRLMAHLVKGQAVPSRYEGTVAEEMVEASLKYDALLRGDGVALATTECADVLA